MMPTLLSRFDPPGAVADLSEEGLAAWHTKVSTLFDAAATGPEGDPTDAPRAQFYNPATTETADDQAERAITWTAFPRTIATTSSSEAERWEKADASRRVQDEYCEWSVDRDGEGKIVRVSFTSEVPEYWEHLAEHDPDLVLEMYRQFTSPEVQAADLLGPDGTYDRENRWNSATTGGLVHMIQGSNNLWAAVELAAAATIVREIDGRPLTSQAELIRCSRYGVESRNSDPHIGASVNELARMKADITLANPPGLYLADLSTTGWTTPDGDDPRSFWRYVRGKEGHRVRAVYEVPPEKDYVVGDVEINGQPIQFGSQIADFITIQVTGVACRFGLSAGVPFTVCKGQGA